MDGEGKFWAVVTLCAALFLTAVVGAVVWSEHDSEITRRACLEHHSPSDCATMRLR